MDKVIGFTIKIDGVTTISKGVKSLADLLEDVGNLLEGISQDESFKNQGKEIGKTTTRVKKLVDELGKVGEARTIDPSLMDQAKEIVEEVKKINSELQEDQGDPELLSDLEKINSQVKEVESSYERLNAEVARQDQIADQSDLREELVKTEQQLDKLLDDFEKMGKEVRESAAGTQTVEAISKLRAKFEMLTEAIEGTPRPDFDFNQLQQYRDKLSEITLELNELEKAGQDAGRQADLKEEIGETVAAINELEKIGKKFKLRIFEQGSEDDLVEQLKEARKVLKGISDEEKESDFGKAALERVQRLNSEVKQLRREQREANELDFEPGSYRALNAELVRLRRQWKELGEEARETLGQDMLERIQELDAELKDLDASVGQFQRNVGNYASGAQALLDQVSGGLASSIASAFTNPIAAAGAALGLLQKGGEALKILTDDVVRLRGQLQILNEEASQSELDELAARIRALSSGEVEGIDAEESEVLKATNALTKAFPELEQNAEKALDVIEKGFLAGADIQKQLLDQASEYPRLLAEAGFEADEFIAIITSATKEGIFNDKAVDSVKEAGIAIREQTQATKDAVTALLGDQEAAEFFDNINSGRISLSEGITFISEKLGEINPQTQVYGQVVADVFKGAGEDAAGFVDTIADIEFNLDSLIDETNELTRRQLSQLETQQELERSNIRLANLVTDITKGSETFGTQVQTFFIDLLSEVIEIFKPLIDGIKEVFSEVGNLFGLFSTGAEDVDKSNIAIKVLTGGIRGLSAILTFTIKTLSSLIKWIRTTIEESNLLSGIVDKVSKGFQGLVFVVQNIPSIFAAIQAGINQWAENTLLRLAEVRNRAQVFVKQVRKFFTFNAEDKARLDQEINDLKSAREQAAETGRTVGEAMKDAFNESVQKRLDAKISAEKAREAEQAAREAGESTGEAFGEGFGKKLSEAQRAALKQAQEDRKKALANIRRLDTELIEDDSARAEVTVRDQAAGDISQLVGDPDDIERQRVRIEARLALAIQKIAEARTKAYQDQIREAGAQAQTDLSLLVGDPDDIKEQEEKIKATLIQTVNNIRTTVNQSFESQVTAAEAERSALLESLTGTPEEIEANADLINEIYDRVIRDIGANRKRIEQEEAAEILKIRADIEKQFGGEIAAELSEASAEQLRIEKERIERKFGLLDEEAELDRLRIEEKFARQEEELQQELARLDIAKEEELNRANEIADELKQIDAELKEELLQNEVELAEEKFNLTKALVPESITLAEELAEKELEIEREKNAEKLAEAKRNAEERKKLEEDLLAVAFDAAETFSQILFDRENQKAEESNQMRIDGINRRYDAEIEAAQGNAEKEKQIEAKRQQEIEKAEIEAAKKRKAIARKQTVIEFALALAKTLAFYGFTPAAIGPVAGLVVEKLAALLAIDSQRFTEGDDLDRAIEQYFKQGADLVAHSRKTGKRFGLEVLADGGPLDSLPALVDVAKRSTPDVPYQGRIGGKPHALGGVRVRYRGMPSEFEGGEYFLRNGDRTYIINKRSTARFLPELEKMRGGGPFSERKHQLASAINSYQGFGRAFQDGGELAVPGFDPVPIPAPSIRTQATEEERIMTRKLIEQNQLLMQQNRTTSARVKELERIVLTLQVIADSKDIVEKGSAQIEEASTKRLNA